MSSIKPPGSLPGVPLAPEAAASTPASATQDVSKSAASARPEAAASVGGSAASDALAEIARAVAEGTLSVETAVERLVERAVGPFVPRLSEAERDELVALLRDALAHDPALGSLRDSVR